MTISLQTTEVRPGPDQRRALVDRGPVAPEDVARLAHALHFLCAAVRCNYEPATIRAAGYLDAGLVALRAVGWDPDKAQIWAGAMVAQRDASGAPATALPDSAGRAPADEDLNAFYLREMGLTKADMEHYEAHAPMTQVAKLLAAKGIN